VSKQTRHSWYTVPADVSESIQPLWRVLSRSWRVEAVLAGLPEQRACLIDVKFLVYFTDSLWRRHWRPLDATVGRWQAEDVKFKNGIRQLALHNTSHHHLVRTSENEQEQLYSRSGTGRCCWIGQQKLCFYSPSGSISTRNNRSWPPSWNYTPLWKPDFASGCIFSGGIFLPNFIPIQVETTEPSAFLKKSPQKQQEEEQMI